MTRLFGNMKLRSHLIALVIAALLPVLIFAGAVVIIHSRSVQERAENGLRDNALTVSLAIDREILASIRTLEALATSEHLDSEDLKKFYDQAKRVLETNEGWETILLVEPSGQQRMNLLRPFGSPLPISREMEAIKKVSETGRPFVTNLFRGTVAEKYLIGVDVPVIRDGKVRYVLAASGSPAFLASLLSQERPSPDWHITVIDRNKTIIAGTHNIDRLLGKPAASLFGAKSDEGRKAISRRVLPEGLDAYVALHRSELSGWTVAVAAPLSSLDSLVRRSIMLLLFGGTALLLAGIFLAVVFGRRIANSISALANSAAALGRGETPKTIASPISEVNQVAWVIEDAAVRRKLAEEAALRLAAIVESSDDAIIGKTLDGIIVSWNRGAEKIYGYSAQEVIGQSVSILIPPGHPDELPVILEKLKNGEHINHFETLRIRKDSRQVRVSLTVSPIIDPTGNITGVSTIARDITEWTRSQEVLRRSEERWRAVFENPGVGIALTDPKGVFTVTNRAFQEMVGYTDEELRVLSYMDITYEEDRQANWALGMELWKDKIRQFIHQKRYRRKDGRLVWVRNTVSLAPGTEAVPRFGIGIVEEITERKRMEEQTQRYIQRLNILQKITESISSTLDTSSVLNALLEKIDLLIPSCVATIRLVNRETGELEPVAFWNLNEKEKAEWLERKESSAAKIVVDTQTPFIVKNVQADPRPAKFEFSRRHAWVSYLGLPLIVNGEILGALNLNTRYEYSFTQEEVEFFTILAGQVAIAIHNAQLYEQSLDGQQRLAHLSRKLLEIQENERRHIAREIHDEIGQTLTALKLSLEMMATLPANQARARLQDSRELVTMIMTEVRSLLHDLRPPMLDQMGLLPTLEWHLKRYTSQTEVRVQLKQAGLERRFPPEIETAAYRIIQEGLNNVARHAGVQEAKLSLEASGATLAFEIEDRGKGFTPERDLLDGAGSGLSGMIERAALLGGRCRVQSSPGNGTLLTVELPTENKQGQSFEFNSLSDV